MMLLLGLLPLALLVTASQLNPDSQGLGTHQQLGLPPCSLRLLFGVRCPACGMTTSWAHFTRGQWFESVQVNSGGFLLALAACVGVVGAAVCLWNPRLDPLRYQKVIGIAAIGIAVVTLVDWAFRLW